MLHLYTKHTKLKKEPYKFTKQKIKNRFIYIPYTISLYKRKWNKNYKKYK